MTVDIADPVPPLKTGRAAFGQGRQHAADETVDAAQQAVPSRHQLVDVHDGHGCVRRTESVCDAVGQIGLARAASPVDADHVGTGSSGH
jgi:hypothetical protein